LAVTYNKPAELPDKRLGDEALQFPNDLENYLFHITFDFRKFTRRDISDRNFYGAGASGSVRLPIPANMIDTTAVQWNDGQHFDPILGSVIDTVARLRAQNDNQKAYADQARDAVANLRKDFAEGRFGPAVAPILQGLNRFAPGASAAAQAVLGVAINPFLTVMFQAPTYKRHQFQWHFNPHTKKETDDLRKILARFRFNMLPTVTPNAAGLLLNYPNMCYVSLHPNNKDLYKFKPCVIEAASINYAPNGPSFFDGTNAPTEIVLTLNLLEIEYWIQDDVFATWDQNLDENGTITVDIGRNTNADRLNDGVQPI
jgi:hypothetical protein